jgi:hypothetical protein
MCGLNAPSIATYRTSLYSRLARLHTKIATSHSFRRAVCDRRDTQITDLPCIRIVSHAARSGDDEAMQAPAHVSAIWPFPLLPLVIARGTRSVQTTQIYHALAFKSRRKKEVIKCTHAPSHVSAILSSHLFPPSTHLSSKPLVTFSPL